MCATPNNIKNPLGGNMVVPCGKCHKCLNKRSTTWAFRLLQEEKIHSNAVFVTLTYTDNPVTLSKRDLQLFFKRLRYNTKRNSIRYYACGEYGTSTYRPHYHAIIFDATPTEIDAAWGLGFTSYGKVELASIKYVTNYMTKGKLTEEQLNGREPEFSLMSKKLGANYLTPQMVKSIRSNKSTNVVTFGGIKLPMPRYYRDKIYTKTERQLLAKKNIALADKAYANAVRDNFNGSHTAFEKSKSDAIIQRTNFKINSLKLKRNKV